MATSGSCSASTLSGEARKTESWKSTGAPTDAASAATSSSCLPTARSQLRDRGRSTEHSATSAGQTRGRFEEQLHAVLVGWGVAFRKRVERSRSDSLHAARQDLASEHRFCDAQVGASGQGGKSGPVARELQSRHFLWIFPCLISSLSVVGRPSSGAWYLKAVSAPRRTVIRSNAGERCSISADSPSWQRTRSHKPARGGPAAGTQVGRWVCAHPLHNRTWRRRATQLHLNANLNL